MWRQKLELSNDEYEEMSKFVQNMIDLIKKCLDCKYLSEKCTKENLTILSIAQRIKCLNFFPLGSYALGHMRNTHKTIDFLLVYELTKEEYLVDITPRVILETLAGVLRGGNKNQSFEIKYGKLEQRMDTKPEYLEFYDHASGISFRLLVACSEFTKQQESLAKVAKKYDQRLVLIAQIDNTLRKYESRRPFFNKLSIYLKYWRYYFFPD